MTDEWLKQASLRLYRITEMCTAHVNTLDMNNPTHRDFERTLKYAMEDIEELSQLMSIQGYVMGEFKDTGTKDASKTFHKEEMVNKLVQHFFKKEYDLKHITQD